MVARAAALFHLHSKLARPPVSAPVRNALFLCASTIAAVPKAAQSRKNAKMQQIAYTIPTQVFLVAFYVCETNH
jgi:hypothetical protein